MDILNPSNQIVNSAFINEICQQNPNVQIWPEFEQEEYKRKIKEYYLDKEFIAYTFTENQLKGTPSFILFNESFSCQTLTLCQRQITTYKSKCYESQNKLKNF